MQFDADTLGAAGVAYDVPGQLTTAHPHMDRATKGMFNFAAKLGPRFELPLLPAPSGSGEAKNHRHQAGVTPPPTCTRSASPSAGSCSPSSRTS